jgi:hypothetical protein
MLHTEVTDMLTVQAYDAVFHIQSSMIQLFFAAEFMLVKFHTHSYRRELAHFSKYITTRNAAPNSSSLIYHHNTAC